MNHTTSEMTDWRLASPEVIALESEQFDWSEQIAQTMVGESWQWQTYLQGLAYSGFVDWLTERGQNPGLTVMGRRCSLHQPAIASVIDSVCNLRVGAFRLALLVVENLFAEEILLPKAIIELPEFAAHFYAVLEVQEEWGQVLVRGHERYATLAQACHAQVNPEPESWHYALPLTAFDSEPNHLLVQLQQLEPAAVALPSFSNEKQAVETGCWQMIQTWLRSPEDALADHLSWEQGRAILQNPPLLKQLYRWRRQFQAGQFFGQTASQTVDQAANQRWRSAPAQLSILFQTLAQPAINVATWLGGEVDTAAAGAGLFLPQLTPVTSGLRSIDKFQAAIAELRRQGMLIPESAVYAYQDIDLRGVPVRLCTVHWLSSPDEAPSWSLLALLGMQMGTSLPNGVRMAISTPDQEMAAPVSEFNDPFLYAKVDGHTEAPFVITLTPIDGPNWVSLPFVYDNESDDG
ncbi:MAG: DUF1822 family protein [Cyanobacteria bacterium J06642_9]